MSFSYPGTSTSTQTWNGNTYTVDMEALTFKYNVYTENFATRGKGLVDITGAPRVFFTAETFTGNGDATSNVLSTYGSGILTAATSEMSIDSALASPGTYTGGYLSQGPIRITRSA